MLQEWAIGDGWLQAMARCCTTTATPRTSGKQRMAVGLLLEKGNLLMRYALAARPSCTASLP